MTNIVLLSGLDGTGVLFEPFIRHMPKNVQADLFIYDLNAHDNQSISFQCDCIEKQLRQRLGYLAMNWLSVNTCISLA